MDRHGGGGGVDRKQVVVDNKRKLKYWGNPKDCEPVPGGPDEGRMVRATNGTGRTLELIGLTLKTTDWRRAVWMLYGQDKPLPRL